MHRPPTPDATSCHWLIIYPPPPTPHHYPVLSRASSIVLRDVHRRMYGQFVDLFAAGMEWHRGCLTVAGGLIDSGSGAIVARHVAPTAIDAQVDGLGRVRCLEIKNVNNRAKFLNFCRRKRVEVSFVEILFVYFFVLVEY